MSDDKKRSDNVRRVGKRDQKDQTKNRRDLLPKPEVEPEADIPSGMTLAELDALVEANKSSIDQINPPEEPWLLEEISDETAASQSASHETRPTAAQKPVPRKREKRITEPAERFPPIAPPPEAATKQPAQPQKAVQSQPEPSPFALRRRNRTHGSWRHNLVALIFLLATCGLLYYFSIIWRDQYSPLNPLAKPTPFVEVSETPDPIAVASYFATQTATARGPVQSFNQPTPFATPDSFFPFALTGSGVLYIPNANGNDCDWASIAGSVTYQQGQPINNYGIQITDATNPGLLDVKVFSGSALTFGEGGFELTLAGTPTAGEYEVQLFSPAGAPVSQVYTITTHDTCDKNVAILNFVQTRAM